MAWVLEGDNIIAALDGPVRIVEELYQRGFCLIPQLLLADQAEYGDRIDDSRIQISKERFFQVAIGLREKIRTDTSYKAELRRITWTLLHEFARATRRLNSAVRGGSLTPDLLVECLDAHARVLALTEFNGILPFAWYRECLTVLSGTGARLTVEDFAYSEVVPHIIQLRQGKLHLLKQYHNNCGRLTDSDIASFVRRLGCHDLPWLSPLLMRPQEQLERTREEIVAMARSTTAIEASRELARMRSNRQVAREHYEANLATAAKAMLERDDDGAKVHNFISALAILSLATTEEEVRHIWQDHFWKGLGAIMRGLELPVRVASVQDVVSSLRQHPQFVPDFLP